MSSSESEAEENPYDQGDERVKFSKLFVLQQVLGKGAFGIVVSAIMKANLKEYAVKIIQKKILDSVQYEAFMREADILRQLNHDSIVKFVRMIESETRVFLVMELSSGGQLQEYIKERYQNGNPLNDEEASTIMRCIFSAVTHLHSKDIIHRDLKPQNILLADKNNLSSIKICDFGLSVQYEPDQQSAKFTIRCGTRIFMAPELYQKKQYGKPVDLWSCGVILYMLLSGGKHPLYESNDTEETYMIKLENPEWVFPSSFNRYSKDLFLKLICGDPIERYTCEHAMNHPWITRRFQDDIPLTSPEKMRAFSQSQTLSRMFKTMYMVYKFPGAKTEVEGQHRQKIAETNDKFDSLAKKSPLLGANYRLFFDTNNDNNLELTTATSNPNKDSGSGSPASSNSTTFSPKYPILNSQPLLPIQETMMTETTKDMEGDFNLNVERKRGVTMGYTGENFTLPEAQNTFNGSKKLHFTLSVTPIKYEGPKAEDDIKAMKNDTSIQMLDPALDDSKVQIRKAKTFEGDAGNSLVKKLHFRSPNTIIGNGASSLTFTSGPNSPIIPKITSNGNSISVKTVKKSPVLRSSMGPQLVDQLRVTQRNDKLLTKSQVSNMNKPHSPDSARNGGEFESPVPTYNEINNPTEGETRNVLKNRSPLIRKTKVGFNPVNDEKARDVRSLKLPSIGIETRGRGTSTSHKKPPGATDPVVKAHATRFSISPIKGSKDWSPSKDVRSKMFITDKMGVKERFDFMLDTQYANSFGKKAFQ